MKYAHYADTTEQKYFPERPRFVTQRYSRHLWHLVAFEERRREG